MSERSGPAGDNGGDGSAPRGGSTVVAIPRAWLILMTVLLIGPWLFLGAGWMWPDDDTGAPASAAIAAAMWRPGPGANCSCRRS